MPWPGAARGSRTSCSRGAQVRHDGAARGAGAAPAAVPVASQGAEVLPHRRAAADVRRRAGRRADLRRARLAARRLRGAVRRRPAGALCGESTCSTCTTATRSAGSATLVPDARLIAVLRDPVERAHSNWAHLRAAGLEPEARLRDGACDREQRRIAAGWATSGTTPPWAVTASSSSTCSRCSRASRCCCSATGSCATSRWRRGPGLPVPRRRQGVVTGVPRQNVRPDVSGRTGGRVGGGAGGGAAAVRRRRAAGGGADGLGPGRLVEMNTTWRR